MAEGIRATAAEHAAAPGPCAFVAWSGEIAGREVEVVVEETESNTKLCGPACLNEVFVHNGSVLGVPDTAKGNRPPEGVSTGSPTWTPWHACSQDEEGQVRERFASGEDGKTPLRCQPAYRGLRDALHHRPQQKSGSPRSGLSDGQVGHPEAGGLKGLNHHGLYLFGLSCSYWEAIKPVRSWFDAIGSPPW